MEPTRSQSKVPLIASIIGVTVVGMGIGGFVFRDSLFAWSRQVGIRADTTAAKQSSEEPANHDDDHDHDHEGDHDHGHSHAGHDESNSIELSSAALRNIGYTPIRIDPQTYFRTVAIPSMVVERPGRSQIHITAPFTGVITDVTTERGAAVEPQTPLFEIRLTHEELVQAQSDLIRTAENLEVVNRELTRLQNITDGVVPRKQILDQEYERQRLSASLRAERQALLLHGLTESDVAQILSTKTLLQSLTIFAPTHDEHDGGCTGEHLFHVQSLGVFKGQQVTAGDRLCILADHCELYVEGHAFADDAEDLREASRRGWNISARRLTAKRTNDTVEGLKLLYLADHVDPDSRAFRFYLRLPNEIALDQSDARGYRFLDWKFKPGQRMELLVPVEKWPRRFVLPPESVIEEGAETYVYVQHEDHFERVVVHVEFRDQQAVVIADDGSLYSGDLVAGVGAYQIHLALKNQLGGGVDPHAGHNH